MNALLRLHTRLRDLWAGKKTNLVLILQGAALILAARGIQVDPQDIVTWIEDFGGWIEAGIALVTAAGIYFRQLGRQRERNERITADSLLGELNRADERITELEKSGAAKRAPAARKAKKKARAKR